jgi:hypothetical protein
MAMEHEDDEGAEDHADVEVERMPNLGGWEYFKAVDGASERWTLALQHRRDQGAIEYAFWTDMKKDPAATGVLEAGRDTDKRWVKAVHKAAQRSEDGALDNDARAEVILAILRQHDPTLDSYEAHLLFTLDPPPDEDEDEDEDEEDEDDDDEDDGDEDDDDD